MPEKVKSDQRLRRRCSIELGWFLCCRHILSLYLLAIGIRWFSAVHLSPFLLNSKEFVTPWNSFNRVREAIYLQSIGINAYDGDMFHLVRIQKRDLNFYWPYRTDTLNYINFLQMPLSVNLFRVFVHSFWGCFLLFAVSFKQFKN